MPVMDSFHVVDVVEGQLKATSINVRPRSFRGPGYPRNLQAGRALTLRLNLAAQTQAQAEENDREKRDWLVVNGDEVEEIRTP
jgi:hypothetical protein